MLGAQFSRSTLRILRVPRIHPPRVMSRKYAVDMTPPEYTGIPSSSVFDRKVFTKSFEILAVRAPVSKISAILNAPEMQGYLLRIPRRRGVDVDPQDPKNSRLVILNIADKADLPEKAVHYLETQAESKGLVPHRMTLDYDYWTADDVIRAILPEHLKELAPSGFAATGHIAHLNLNAEYVPYRKLIGQIILDKNKTIRTVVNKIDTIHSVYRFFDMELIAGEPDYIVKHNETDCTFTFDFREVYWNSRLHTEHARLVELFKPDDVVADVFAGVGPFSIPAAKKGCAVFANDLNPNSAKYLEINVKNNKVKRLVRVFCEDGRDFIRSVIRRSFEEPFSARLPPRPSNLQRTAHQKVNRAGSPHRARSPTMGPPRGRISHFVMNLPDTAITFLDAFRGILVSDEVPGLREAYDVMPMIHCYCFTRELDPEKAKADIMQRVEEKLGSSITTDVDVYWVRSVAPTKEMYCISFRLPSEVAFNASG